MVITWYGQRCIRIEAKEGSVLVDPFGKDAGLRGPKMNDDIVLISSYIAPEDVLSQISAESFVIRGPGEYESKGIAVRGIQSWQDSQQGKELGLATIYIIIADEMSVCHLGATGQGALTNEQIEAIGNPDILIIPVGGQSAMDAKVAVQICTLIEPKIIIPLGESGAFIKEIGLQPEKMEVFRVSKKQLPTDQTQLIVLTS